MSLAVGTRIGPYEVNALIGEGGMGKVWRAHHTALKRDDALKALPDPLRAGKGALEPNAQQKHRRDRAPTITSPAMMTGVGVCTGRKACGFSDDRKLKTEPVRSTLARAHGRRR